MKYAKRFVLPLVLLAVAVGLFIAADRLGSTEISRAPTGVIDHVDVPLASIRRLPEIATAPFNAELLAASVPTEPVGLSALSCLTIMVDGQVVHDVRGDVPLVPGFAQLMATGHAAIELLGPDYRYQTTVFADALPDDEGRVFGPLYLVGGGDPVLMSFTYAQGFRPTLGTRTSVEDLAVAVAQAGVIGIDGGVVGAEQRYDTQRVLPGWPEIYTTSGLAGPLSALQLDDGFAERAAANGGVAIPAEEPALHAAQRFDDLLEDLGITIAGGSEVLAPDNQIGDLVPVARIESPPLSEIVFQTLAVNDASAAEMILKEIGFVDRRDGSTRAGAEAVRRILTEQGVDLAVAPRDGSGLDPVSTTSCRQLAATADTIPDGHPTLDILPRHDLPGVFGGEFADVELNADLRLVGGDAGDAAGFVARTVGDGRRVVVASIVNRIGGRGFADGDYQRAAVEAVDAVLVSTDPSLIEIAPPEDP